MIFSGLRPLRRRSEDFATPQGASEVCHSHDLYSVVCGASMGRQGDNDASLSLRMIFAQLTEVRQVAGPNSR